MHTWNNHFGPPNMPDEFWDHSEIQQAARERHIGRLLRAYRTLQRPRMTQLQLAGWLGIDQSNLSRHERAARPTVDLDKLMQWASILRIPQRLLWFQLHPTHTSEPAPASPTLATVEESGDVDVHRRQFLRASGMTALGMVCSGTAQAVPSGSTVEEIRRMTAGFRAQDNSFGGSYGRSALAAYFSRTVEPLLTSRAKPPLLVAAAEMQQVAGWMAYDVGQPEIGRRHLREALRLCQRAGEEALAAEMLAGMSHQAAFLGAGDSAVDLALAAQQIAGRVHLPALTAEINVLEAHGYAIKGDRAECLAALHHSEQAFEHADGDRPDWLRYFDRSYMAAKTAHVLRDLGASAEAEAYARESLQMAEGYERGRLFNTALLASILADQRRVEEACAEGARAVSMLHRVRSVRALAYLSDLARRLAPFARTTSVKHLYDRFHSVGVVTPRM